MKKAYIAGGAAVASLLILGTGAATADWSPVALEQTVATHESRLKTLEEKNGISPSPTPSATTTPENISGTSSTNLTPMSSSIAPSKANANVVTNTPVAAPETAVATTPTPLPTGPTINCFMYTQQPVYSGGVEIEPAHMVSTCQ